jgi:hypothetical protein
MTGTFFKKIKENPEKYEEWKKLNSFTIMKQYNTDPEYRQKCIDSVKRRVRDKKEEHYKRWDEDEQYRNECKAKGMRDCRSRRKFQGT